MIYASIAGAYPRIGKEYGHDLRRIWHEYDKGIVSFEQVREAEDEVIRFIVKEQEEAGMDLITDGEVRWSDPISHIGRKLGFNIGALHHYYDTNFHVRKIFGEKKEWAPLLKGEVDFLRTCTDKKILVVLPKDFDLERHSNRDRKYWSSILEKEKESLSGVEYVENYVVAMVVDPRNAIMENPKQIAKEIYEDIRETETTEDILLIPSWRLDVLPHCYAKQKMEILGQIKKELCDLLP